MANCDIANNRVKILMYILFFVLLKYLLTSFITNKNTIQNHSDYMKRFLNLIYNNI